MITTGGNFPDALSSSYLAQKAKATILLVRGSDVKSAEEVIEVINVKDILIIGGPLAVSENSVNALTMLHNYTT